MIKRMEVDGEMETSQPPPGFIAESALEGNFELGHPSWLLFLLEAREGRYSLYDDFCIAQIET